MTVILSQQMMDGSAPHNDSLATDVAAEDKKDSRVRQSQRWKQPGLPSLHSSHLPISGSIFHFKEVSVDHPSQDF